MHSTQAVLRFSTGSFWHYNMNVSRLDSVGLWFSFRRKDPLQQMKLEVITKNVKY